jgi:hypothetical protein
VKLRPLRTTANAPKIRRTVRTVGVGARGAKRVRLEPEFTRVKNMANDKEGTVHDILSEMITVYYDDNSGLDFFFKKYYGLSWRLV